MLSTKMFDELNELVNQLEFRLLVLINICLTIPLFI